MKSLSDTPKALRPREKLLRHGTSHVSLVELIAIILGTGTAREPVHKIAQRIAKLLQKNPTPTYTDLIQIEITPAKALQILAALALAPQLATHHTSIHPQTPSDIYAQCMDIAHSTREHVVVFYFDGRGALVHREIISTGTHNTSRLVPKEIFHPIKAFPVDAIILAHNHPSGYLEASKEDILFTTRVRHAAEILGITLLDHLIITATGWKQIDKEINR